MRKRRIAAGMAVIILLLTGCSFGKTDIVFTTGLAQDEVFKIESSTVSVAQAKVYLCNYQNLYGNTYDINLWEQDFKTASLENYVKDVTLQEMTRVICMDMLAQQEEITLTSDEVDLVRAAAKQYYLSLSKDEVAYMGITEKMIEGLYADYALAKKVYQALTTGVDEEVSDDEARVMEAQQIQVSDQSRAAEVAAQLAQGKDFLTVATDYNEASEIDITFGRGDMPGEVEDIAFNLENNQVSDCITTDQGYYFIKCVNKFNQELTDNNKITIVQKREKAAFNDEYDALVERVTSTLNTKIWDELELKTDGTITTNSFFAVIDQYFSEPEE